IAAALGARVRLIKDVDGVYDADPNLVGEAAHPFAALDFELAEKLAHPLVQDKAIRLARQHGLKIEVAALGRGYATTIGETTQARTARPYKDRLTVALLGCGVVGSQVLERLLEWEDLFSVQTILVRDVARRASHPLADRFTADLRSFEKADVDLFIDAGAGIQPSASLIERFLQRGIAVVSANKQAVAHSGAAIMAAAAASGAPFRYSAAVGGGAPFIENLSRAAANGTVTAIEAVLNGTSNFVLDKCRFGLSFDAAMAEARRLGYAEPDSTADLDGTDAGAKLKLLREIAFADLPLLRIDVEPITPERLAAPEGTVLRYVGRCERQAATAGSPAGLVASLRLEALPPEHFLVGAVNEENRMEIQLQAADGAAQTWRVWGKGAGPWPTSESVLADILDIRRGREAKA
ncbi:MAG: homoserine dehydrogenase, partial [Asticcacaulis sp.]